MTSFYPPVLWIGVDRIISSLFVPHERAKVRGGLMSLPSDAVVLFDEKFS